MAAPLNLSRQRIQAGTPLLNIFIERRPKFPPDVLKRFPSLNQFQKEDADWVRKLTFQVQGGGK